jgi:ABC-type nitrate/sulfonate/bicarbonate transport system substrate-binding protein
LTVLFVIIAGVSGAFFNYALPQGKSFSLILNTWGGWAPILAANNGTKPNSTSLLYRECGFSLDISIVENFADSWAAINAGKADMMGLTLDMMALMGEGVKAKGSPLPQAFMQIDWSAGGDGILVRRINSISDFVGKEGILALNSPSQYFILDALIKGGVDPKKVKFVGADDAFLAGNTFAANSKLDFAVSWAPVIYEIPEKDKSVRLFLTTAEASRVIADVLIGRPAFLKANQAQVKCMMRAIFKGMDAVKTSPDRVAEIMAQVFQLPATETSAMMKDAELTDLRANAEFFLKADNSAGLKSIFESAQRAYKSIGSVGGTVTYDEVSYAVLVDQLSR